jgi:hypothetical protein
VVVVALPGTQQTVALVETSLRRMVTSEKMGLLAREGVAVVVQAGHDTTPQTTTTPGVAAVALGCLDRGQMALLALSEPTAVAVVVVGQAGRTGKRRQAM